MNTTILGAPAVPLTQAKYSFNYRLGRFVLRYYGLWGALVLVLAWMNCFWRLSTNVVSDLDEARYGVAASEMLRNHSALIATYAGQPEYWNLKPPLGYWMQELAFRALGSTVFAMRVPSALCAMVLIGLTMGICRRWYGRRPAVLAGVVMATCYGFMSYHGARSGDLDSALSLIVLAATILTPRLTRDARARLMWAAMLALGFLLKSFAILPCVLVTVLYLLWTREYRQIRWRQWLPAALLFTGVVLAWIAARAHQDGSMYFVNRMFREDLFWRSTRVLDDETVRPWGYLSVLGERFAPWPVVILAAAFLTRRPRAGLDRHTRLLLLWALVPLVAFSLARTQHHWYLDPSYPAWSMLAALATVRIIGLTRGQGRVIGLSLVALALILCEARVLRRIGWIDRPPASQTFLMSLRDHARLPAEDIIYADFPLAHSERFILQVVDGYRVMEVDGTTTLGSLTQRPHVVLLLGRQSAGTQPVVPTGWQPVVRSSDYLLLQPAIAGRVALVPANSH